VSIVQNPGDHGATLRHCCWREAMIQEQADLHSTELMEILDFCGCLCCLVDQWGCLGISSRLVQHDLDSQHLPECTSLRL